MKIPKQQAQVKQIELVETYNIYLSIKRIKDAPGYDDHRWKRALYHAVGMAIIGHSEQEKIRQALGLP